MPRTLQHLGFAPAVDTGLRPTAISRLRDALYIPVAVPESQGGGR